MATKAARRQARATARVSRIQKRYGLVPDYAANMGVSPSPTPVGLVAGDVTIPSTALPPPSISSPITAVMETAPVIQPSEVFNPSTLQYDMATSLPRITKQQLRYERRQLKKMPGELRRVKRLNELRAMQEFTLNQQVGAPPDLSLIRGGAQYLGPTQQGSAAQMFDPMAAGAAGTPPGPGAPYPGSFGPPQNQFSPTQFQPGSGASPGGMMLPPSQSGVPGGLIYTDMPSIEQQFAVTSPETDINAEPIFEEEGEQFGYAASFADMEPLDSYGAVTGEPAQVGFFDKLGNLLSTGADKYADVAKAQASAKTAKYQATGKSRAIAPASAGMSVGGSLDKSTLVYLALAALGGILFFRSQRS